MFRRVAVSVVSIGLIGFAAFADTGDAVRVAGVLSKIDGKTLTITADSSATVITCNASTRIGRDGGQATFEDLQVGQPVRAYYAPDGNVAKAVIIAKAAGAAPAPKPATAPVRIAGSLTKVDGKTLTISADGAETVITVTGSTRIGKDGGRATFEDLQAGQTVRSYYNKTDNTAVAVIIAGP